VYGSDVIHTACELGFVIEDAAEEWLQQEYGDDLDRLADDLGVSQKAVED
jgi:hypothetical protein